MQEAHEIGFALKKVQFAHVINEVCLYPNPLRINLPCSSIFQQRKRERSELWIQEPSTEHRTRRWRKSSHRKEVSGNKKSSSCPDMSVIEDLRSSLSISPQPGVPTRTGVPGRHNGCGGKQGKRLGGLRLTRLAEGRRGRI